jgi:hypothetical protein
MIPLRRSRIAIVAGPALEAVTDHDQRAFAVLGRIRVAQRVPFNFNRPVILGHCFERAQEFPARRRNLPSFVITQHVTVAKNIDERDAARETLDTRVPVRTTGREDSDVSFKGSERGSTAGVTGQHLQNSNLYTHTNASDRHGSFCSTRSASEYFVAGVAVQPGAASYPQASTY